MSSFDVVVVGAGPAGATAAKVLAEHGIKVLLIDKHVVPREKPCGGGLPTRVVKRFPYTGKLIDSISYSSITYSSSLRYRLRVARNKPVLFMCQRTMFDQSLIELAEKKGVFFQENKTVVDVIITREKAVIVLNDGEQIETQMVLGCDGIHSIVAEKTNLAEEHTHICVCMYQETPMSKKTLDALYSEKRTVHIFIKALGIAGYGWIFPKKKTVNVGLGVFESAVDTTKPKINLREIYTKFVAVLKEKNLLPPEFSGDDAKGGILPIFPLKKTYADRVLLCGDAAGFINPITGEGIYYAMVSGELAAQVAAKAITTHKTSQDFLSTYHKKWSSEFGDDLRLLGRFNSQWGKDSEKIVRLLSADKPLAKLTIGIMGGQLSFSKYRYLLYLRYLYASLKIALIYPGEKKK